MSSAHVASSAREHMLVICSSAPRLSHASTLSGSGLGGRCSLRARFSSASTSGNSRANAWLAAAARLKTMRWSPRVTLDVMTVTDGPASWRS
jgi:hypothetical protein